MRRIEVGFAWKGGKNIICGSEEEAKKAVLARHPGARFQDWVPCEEPEAAENEYVMWAVNENGEPLVALYEVVE